MADYTYSEIMKMQNDAVKRVEEMQKRARLSLEKPDSEADKEKTDADKSSLNVTVNEPRHIKMPSGYLDELKRFASTSSHIDKEIKKDSAEKTPAAAVNEAEGFLNADIDKDKALILSLIMLLSDEQADETLILALLYMLT